MRQHLGYGHWYDRQKLTQKNIGGTQYIACMNPTAGSFNIDPRLQVGDATQLQRPLLAVPAERRNGTVWMHAAAGIPRGWQCCHQQPCRRAPVLPSNGLLCCSACL